MNLIGKVIVVTGAESGIGREIAKTCSAEGATLVLAGLSLSGMEETAAQCGGDHISCCTTDISDEAQVTSLVAHAVQRHGAMHGLVANAGITGPRNALVDIALHDWRSVIDIDLTGTFLTAREAARHMIEQGQGGSIVITGSSTAIRPLSGFLPYIAAKGGLHAMAEALALELGSHRIRVNTLVAHEAHASVRVRLSDEGAWLTLKSGRAGIVRDEFEYEISRIDAEDMLDRLCVGPVIEKTRYRVLHGGKIWEVDVFAGRAEGLVLAEIELAATDEPFDLPDWAGKEVTDDPRFRNSAIALIPMAEVAA